MHGVAFGGAGFVNDALEETADRGVGHGPGLLRFGIGEHSFSRSAGTAEFLASCLSCRFPERSANVRFKEFDELLVDFVDAPSPVAEVHGRAPAIAGANGRI